MKKPNPSQGGDGKPRVVCACYTVDNSEPEAVLMTAELPSMTSSRSQLVQFGFFNPYAA
jgi:hypothetical protein